MKFGEWKAKMLVILSKMMQDNNAKDKIFPLIQKLKYLRHRDVGRFMLELLRIADEFPNYKNKILSSFPKEEDISNWFSKSGKR